MRSDFLGESANYPGLTELINHSSYLVPQMTRDQQRTAIEGPVAVGGGRITKSRTDESTSKARPTSIYLLSIAQFIHDVNMD